MQLMGDLHCTGYDINTQKKGINLTYNQSNIHYPTNTNRAMHNVKVTFTKYPVNDPCARRDRNTNVLTKLAS